MSTYTTNILFDSSSDANFRAWGSAFNAILTAGGFWGQTSDTGQINWTTVTHPSGTSVFQGYEIYKSQDSLSSTFPIYMRVDYGAGTGSPLNAAIKIQFGTGTNGAGTLTGNTSSTMAMLSGVAGQGSTLFPCYASGAAGGFSCLLWDGTATTSGAVALAVERSLDSTGAYTSSYFTYVLSGPQQGIDQQSIQNPSIGGAFTLISNAFTLYFSGTTSSSGSNASLFPIFPFVGFPDNPMTRVTGMKTGDAVTSSSYSATMYGSSRTYLFGNRSSVSLGNTVALGFAIRYD